MGTEYRLVKLDKPEFFDLGKSFSGPFGGAYYRPFLVPQLFSTPTVLQKAFEDLILTGWFEESFKRDPKLSVWCANLSNRIHDFALWDRVLLMSDTNYDDYIEQLVLITERPDLRVDRHWYYPTVLDGSLYKETGSRFHD